MGNLIFILALIGLGLLAFGAIAKFRDKAKEAALAGNLREVADQQNLRGPRSS